MNVTNCEYALTVYASMSKGHTDANAMKDMITTWRTRCVLVRLAKFEVMMLEIVTVNVIFLKYFL